METCNHSGTVVDMVNLKLITLFEMSLILLPHFLSLSISQSHRRARSVLMKKRT